MRLIIGVLTGAAFCLVAGCSGSQNATVVKDVLDSAKTALAPDRRTAVFDVKGEAHDRTIQLSGEIHSADLRDRLLGFVRDAGYEPVDSLVVLPSAKLGERTIGIVSQSVANVRTKPGHAAEMGTQALMGTPVRILKEDDNWRYIQMPDEYLGWTDGRIVAMSRAEYEAWAAKPKVVVTTEVGFVRSGRDPGSIPVTDIVAGSLLAFKAVGETHYEVEYPDGRTGFLPKEHGELYGSWLSATADTPERVLATAYRFFGVPYLWGGTSAKGMDCSGFTKTVYFLNGVMLPRDANQQVRVGEPVPTDNNMAAVRPGDLLFFGSRAREGRPERVTHVGISLGGKRFIHTPGGGGVSTNSMDPADPDYSKGRENGFLHARRVIGAGEDRGIRRLTTIPYYRVPMP
jgi:SH3-like domain-containing protein